MRLSAIAAILFLLTAQCASAAPLRTAEVVREGIATTLDRQLTQAADSGFDGAVIVEAKGEIMLKAGYGAANRDAKTPFTPDTIAQIGSITKPLTAIAVLQLVEQGKLDLNAMAKSYLSGASEPAASATVHQLLTHHAGLADSCAEDFDKITRDDLQHRCMAMPLAHKVGDEGYSNIGYSILAALVEQASGQTWEAYLREHVFTPIGMTHTGFTFPASNNKDFATGYSKDQPQGVISDRIASLAGADWALRGNGGIQASANDMERLYRAFVGRAPGISRRVFELMTKPHERIDDKAFESYGFAVRVDDTGTPYRVGGAGSDGTFFSYFGWYPKDDVFIYFVGSNGEDAVKPVLQETLKTLQTSLGIGPAAPTRPAQ